MPGPLLQFVSHLRPAARRGWPCSTLEARPPFPSVWPGLDPPAVTTARASSPIAPCPSVKGKGQVSSRSEVSGCSQHHASTAAQGALPGWPRWEQMRWGCNGGVTEAMGARDQILLSLSSWRHSGRVREMEEEKEERGKPGWGELPWLRGSGKGLEQVALGRSIQILS